MKQLALVAQGYRNRKLDVMPGGQEELKGSVFDYFPHRLRSQAGPKLEDDAEHALSGNDDP